MKCSVHIFFSYLTILLSAIKLSIKKIQLGKPFFHKLLHAKTDLFEKYTFILYISIFWLPITWFSVYPVVSKYWRIIFGSSHIAQVVPPFSFWFFIKILETTANRTQTLKTHRMYTHAKWCVRRQTSWYTSIFLKCVNEATGLYYLPAWSAALVLKFVRRVGGLVVTPPQTAFH